MEEPVAGDAAARRPEYTCGAQEREGVRVVVVVEMVRRVHCENSKAALLIPHEHEHKNVTPSAYRYAVTSPQQFSAVHA